MRCVKTNGTAYVARNKNSPLASISYVCSRYVDPGIAEEAIDGGLAGTGTDGVNGVWVGEAAAYSAVWTFDNVGEVGGG